MNFFNKYSFQIKAGLILVLVVTGIGFFTAHSDNRLYTTLFSFILGCAIAIWLLVSEIRGRALHHQILSRNAFRPFKDELHFELEERNSYRGYLGVYGGYVFRIYYNWNTLLKNRNMDREAGILLYHQSHLKEDGEVDFERLEKLNRTYRDDGTYFSGKQYLLFELSHLQYHAGFTFLTKHRHLRKHLDNLIRIAGREKLRPINLEDVKNLTELDPYLHGPDIATFYHPEFCL